MGFGIKGWGVSEGCGLSIVVFISLGFEGSTANILDEVAGALSQRRGVARHEVSLTLGKRLT